MPKYIEKDAGKDTHASQKHVSEAWHQAREDARKSGKLPEREANKEPAKEKSAKEKNASSGKNESNK